MAKQVLNVGSAPDDGTGDTVRDGAIKTNDNFTELYDADVVTAAHIASTSNPHSVTKTQVGLGNVDNTSNATERAATATLTNKTLTAPVVNSPTGIVKADVGLGNVDNTSNATERAATATLTNKTLTSPVINSPTGLAKADVGLSNVDNTADSAKPVSSAQQTALNLKEDAADKGAANGYASLGADSKIPTAQLPALAITDTFVVASQAAQVALTAEVGDICIRTDQNKSYILKTDPASTFSNWSELLTPTDSVLSVNSLTGAVTLTTANIADSANKRYVTDANLTVIGNTSGTNTGDNPGVTSVTGSAPIVSSGGNTPAISISAATTSAAGSLSAADKTTLDGLGSISTQDANAVNIDGGNIDGTVIGASTPAALSATTLNTTGAVVFNEAGADVDFRVEGDTNANLLVVDASADAVGIGTATPTANLHIKDGSGNTEIKLQGGASSANDVIAFLNSAGSTRGNITYDTDNDFVLFNVNAAERMRIASDGNVGIGTTAPIAKLTTDSGDIAISSTVASDDGDLGEFQFWNRTNAGSGSGTSFANDVAAIQGKMEGTGNNSGGSLHFYTKPDGETKTEKMTIDGAGKVGIGTTAPQAKLDIRDDIDESSAYNGQLALNSVTKSAGHLARMMFSHDDHGSASIASDYESSGYGNLILSTRGGGNPTERMRIKGDGKVGINKAAPVTQLHIEGGGTSLPATTGTTPSAGTTLRIRPGNNAILDIGGNGTSGAWLQSYDQTGMQTEYPLLLNPNGGNVGIGTAPVEALQVSGAIKVTGAITADTADSGAMGYQSSKFRFISWGADASTKGAYSFEGFSSNGSASATYLSMDSNGNATFGGQLTQSKAGNTELMSLNTTGSVKGGIQCLSNASVRLGSTSNSVTEIVVANVVHMAIDTNGRIVVNSSPVVDSARMSVAFDSANSTGVSIKATNANGGTITRYWNSSNTSIGGITTNGSTVAYSTSSDYRLKENVQYEWNATERLKQLKPCRFNFKINPDDIVDGFIAHEAQEVVPEAVTGFKDEMADAVLYVKGDKLPKGKKIGDIKEESKPVMQGIDQAKLVPLLVKTIQELEARIAKLEAKK